MDIGKVILTEIARVRNKGNGRLIYPSLLTKMLRLAFTPDNYGFDKVSDKDYMIKT
ncbi:hypothetical protein RND71_031958 [Anisodus tanguticus]|uniref:Uncharacterized protein n=1 Tax=Anisodus tanguticus TaxID=243964 RepID=A0AAE1RDL8_9SOLA|nr:hypothetical protein RND71_031958 [Anisodus tanguticus]